MKWFGRFLYFGIFSDLNVLPIDEQCDSLIRQLFRIAFCYENFPGRCANVLAKALFAIKRIRLENNVWSSVFPLPFKRLLMQWTGKFFRKKYKYRKTRVQRTIYCLLRVEDVRRRKSGRIIANAVLGDSSSVPFRW